MKKYLPLIIVFAILMGLYTLAFVYSLLSVLLLTTTLFLAAWCSVLSGRNSQLREINDGLVKMIQTKNEEIGRLSTQIQMILSLHKEEDTDTEKEPENSDV